MKSGKCPKCGSNEVHCMSYGYADLVHVPLDSLTRAYADYYVCVQCGYIEFYVREKGDLPKIAGKWPQVRKTGADEALPRIERE